MQSLPGWWRPESATLASDLLSPGPGPLSYTTASPTSVWDKNDSDKQRNLVLWLPRELKIVIPSLYQFSFFFKKKSMLHLFCLKLAAYLSAFMRRLLTVYNSLFEVVRIFPESKGSFGTIPTVIVYPFCSFVSRNVFHILKSAFWKKASWILSCIGSFCRSLFCFSLWVLLLTLVFTLKSQGLYQQSHLTYPLCDTLLLFTGWA